MRSRVIRLDLYFGWQDEKGPVDREQFKYDVVADDIDDLTQIIRDSVENIVSDLINNMEG